jgi:hypothetical protein
MARVILCGRERCVREVRVLVTDFKGLLERLTWYRRPPETRVKVSSMKSGNLRFTSVLLFTTSESTPQ